VSSRTTPTRETHKFDGATRADLDALLDTQHIGHFAFVVDGRPRVLPIAIARDTSGSGILLHGSTGSTWMRQLATGVPVAVSVTELGGVVVARSAFESSMHFRSAVLFGSCVALEGDEKLRALDVVTEALIPGRVAEIRGHRAKEVAATLVLRMTIDEWTLKHSTGFSEDDADDVAGPAWAGVVPVAVSHGVPQPHPDLRGGIPLPGSVKRMLAE
jgi:nitroimidazol reductase NimA-like FMN-containing flavoprotein (pyridoxamine 5'-phosphate oxidase superfamily)